MPTDATRTGTDSRNRRSRGFDSDDSSPVRRTVTTTAVDGITLVSVELRSEAETALEVRVANELDGPVLPPRREGVPAAGWNADGFHGLVPGEGCLGVGYACPTAPDDDAEFGDEAVSIELLGPPDGDVTESDPVSAAIRSLGRSGPPADAVPATAGDGRARRRSAASLEQRDPQSADGPTDESVGTQSDPEPQTRTHSDPDAQIGTQSGPGGAAATGDRSSDCDFPLPVDRWLDGIEVRLERADRLTDASAVEAAAALESCGGIDAVADLPETVAADAAALRAARERIDDLESRAAETDPAPVVSALSDAAAVADERRTPVSDRTARPLGR